MKIYNGLQLKNGAKVEKNNRMGTLTQPVQFLPRIEKDEEWTQWNMDWLEWRGLMHVRRNARRLQKNYKLAKGIIDKTDYIVESDTEYSDLISNLVEEDNGALELKFYPIIPNVVNTLVSEFAKRNSNIHYIAVDDISYNELLEKKRAEVEQALIADAQSKILFQLQESGYEPSEEEMQQMISPEAIKNLPEIQQFYEQSYRSQFEEWANHQHQIDVERFKMEELEERAFKDMLITDREFWHFKMMDDDYEIELWNPLLVFYHKSPDKRYISESQWVGKFDMMTAADVIDNYGWLMTQDQLETLESIFPIRSAGYAIGGYQNDGTFYDATKSHSWNTNMPSLGYRQFMSTYDDRYQTTDIVNWILSESEDYMDVGNTNLLRVTTAYWKSQRKVGYLTKITEEGEIIKAIVDEDYKITDKAVYDTSLYKNKDEKNLVFGEHIEWIWINQTWGGIKIGPNKPSFWGSNNPEGMNPIYLGINQNKIGPLKFQFKGDSTLYGCKLPVEGSVFSDRSMRSTAMVDLMKPFQIGYNIVNNQIADILVDELGTIIVLDQNALPKKSMGEDWGKNNFSKAYMAMKNFQILPLDTTITNTENALNFQHFQSLNLEQTQRLMSRVELANYFKTQAFEVIGITPQRMGQNITTETATGIQQSLNASYAQTEMYFVQHSDYLMPRVHQMRTDLAQYYNSTKPSVRLQYMTTANQKKIFEINGTELLMRSLNIFISTKANHRNVLEQLKRLAIENNTSGASIYDLGNIIKSESISEVSRILKESQDRLEQQRQQEMQHENEMQQKQLEFEQQQKIQDMQFEASENQKDREARIIERQIQAAGYGSMQDLNQNQNSDYLDALDRIQASQEYSETMDLERQKQISKENYDKQVIDLKREDLKLKKQISDNNLMIARENKTSAELMAKRKLKQDAKKKK